MLIYILICTLSVTLIHLSVTVGVLLAFQALHQLWELTVDGFISQTIHCQLKMNVVKPNSWVTSVTLRKNQWEMVCRRTIRMSLEEKVKEQGEKVRRLKAEKAPKEQVSLWKLLFYHMGFSGEKIAHSVLLGLHSYIVMENTIINNPI